MVWLYMRDVLTWMIFLIPLPLYTFGTTGLCVYDIML